MGGRGSSSRRGGSGGKAGSLSAEAKKMSETIEKLPDVSLKDAYEDRDGVWKMGPYGGVVKTREIGTPENPRWEVQYGDAVRGFSDTQWFDTKEEAVKFAHERVLAHDNYEADESRYRKGTLRRNVLSPMQNVLPDMGYEISESRIENKWTVRHGDNVNTFYLFGGKDESSQNLIQGVTLAGVLFDEVALMPESFVNQATARCSVEGSKWWFNCNPSTPFHWFKVNWIDRKEEKNLLYLHFELDDNRSLSEHIKDRYRNMYQGVFYRRYILGEWVAAEGIIYDMFSEDRHVTKEKYKPVGDVYVSCDYGIQNATVFLMWAKIKGIWTCIREYCYSGRENLKQKTDAEFVQDMKMWLDGTIPKRIIVDPSATSFIAELRKNGYTVKRGMNDVLDGIRYTSTALGRGELMFVSDCVNTIREFHSYMWDLKSTDAGEDRPLKEHDHCMDAMRYFTYTIMRQEKVKVKGFKEGI